jgi:hypothetical protein
MKMTLTPCQALGRFRAPTKKAGHPVKMASLGMRYNLKPSRRDLLDPFA